MKHAAASAARSAAGMLPRGSGHHDAAGIEVARQLGDRVAGSSGSAMAGTPSASDSQIGWSVMNGAGPWAGAAKDRARQRQR